MEITQLTARQGPPQIFKAVQVNWYPHQRPIGHVRYLRNVTSEYNHETQDAVDNAILKALGDLFSGAALVRNLLLLFNEQYATQMLQTRGAADHVIWLHFYDTIGLDTSRYEKGILVKSVPFTLAHWLPRSDERFAFLPDQILVPVEEDLGRVLPTVIPLA